MHVGHVQCAAKLPSSSQQIAQSLCGFGRGGGAKSMFGDDGKGGTRSERSERSFSQVAQFVFLHALTWCINICFI